MLDNISNVFFSCSISSLTEVGIIMYWDHYVFFSFSFFERSHCPDPYNEKTTSDEENFSLRNKRDFELTLPDLPPKNSTYENIAKL